MKILNVRSGFACNSSSTHSIIFSSTPEQDSEVDGGNFGWQPFVAASQEAKRLWLAVNLRSSLREILDNATADLITTEVMGVCPDEDAYVDHQSRISFPRAWSRYGIDLEFVRDFRDYVLQEGVLVAGGNDNSPSDPPAGERVFYRALLPVDKTGNGLVARKDASGYWTIFDRNSGNKIRMSFGAQQLDIDAQRASVPELVDLKITDFCAYDCPTCYQGSTTAGKHGNQYDIMAVLDALAELRVFEVAIGGGEPTSHPDITSIVRRSRDVGIVPNLTTRDVHWYTHYPELVEGVGAVAVSCDTHKDVQRLMRGIDRLPSPELREQVRSKTVVQHILGLQSTYDTTTLAQECAAQEVRLVLLGYKTTHRGATKIPNVPHKGTWGAWLEERLKERALFPNGVGVDTVLAQELKDKVDPWMLTTKEGQFSCYIDATERDPKMYASSFNPGEKPQVLREFYRDPVVLKRAWQKLVAYEPETAYVYGKRVLA